jgi:hypothetical protein
MPDNVVAKINAGHIKEGNVRALQQIIRRYQILGELPE